MVYSFLATWISFIFPVFYKRLQIRNAHWLKQKAPAIIAINHPNAFADPVGLGFIMYPTRFWYLARGDVFKPGFMSWILDKIGIIPIYRISEGGKEGLLKNDATYQRVNQHLKNNLKVIVFAEGLCIMERRLRPIKKGVSRMVFGALESLGEKDLLVIPVGVNYSQPDKFRSDLFYNVGEPISVKEFLKDKDKQSAKTQKAFLEMLEPKLRALITHIEQPENDTLVLQAEELNKREMMEARQLNVNDLSKDLEVLQEITAKINRAASEHPAALETYREGCNQYFHQLQKHQLRDWLMRDNKRYLLNYPMLLLRLFLLILGSPVFVFGFLCNILPHTLSFSITRKIVKHREFFASFITVVAVILFTLYYIMFFLLAWSFGDSLWWALSLVALAMLSAKFNLHYIPFAFKTLGIFRVIKNRKLYQELRAKRKELNLQFNKL
ncbi:MAG: 1-acyl-sn-glycerol-3-phosphate acyltransferase [Bacteroidia bacterium]|jgi:1-acyl-sn-glycerol-3-phosphate acyltransferase|nr:1-acyl-sn-glycerol-3-phosphate acyltransferase [Bacteroidia bacterium]